MKTVSTVVQDAIRKSHNLYAKPRLYVEWNWNRYRPVTVDNIPSESDFGQNHEIFPIESIVKANRPTKGILKARAGEAPTAGYNPAKQKVRHYMASSTAVYKYWSGPGGTNASGYFPTYSTAWADYLGVPTDARADNLTIIRPHILYESPVNANKIVIKTENSWATPTEFSVKIRTTVGGAWTTISGATLNNATGQITLWWNGATWQNTRPTGTAYVATSIAGIMFHVDRMGAGRDPDGNVTTYRKGGATYSTDGGYSTFNLIEIGAYLEVDLTNKLISVNDTMDMSAKSLIYPLGTVTSNVAEVTLSNLYSESEYGLGSDTDTLPGLFNEENTASPFYKLSEPNAQFNLEYVYTVNGVDYPVQQFKMYAETWNRDIDTVTVPLRDYSKFLSEEKPPPLLWTNRKISEIIWRLCDTIGFVDYDVSLGDASQIHLQYFWTDGSKTMWEICDEISQATQTAIYVDAWGRLQIKSRDTAFAEAATSVWTLRGNNSADELTDIISLTPTGEVESNFVTVNYQASDVAEWNEGSPAMDQVWQPEGVAVLRAAVMQNTLGINETWMKLPDDDIKHWPFASLVQVEAEIIKYDGKEYVWYDGSGTRHTDLVRSQADFDSYNASTPEGNRWKNGYTGRVFITERGVWNSEQKEHSVEANGYSVRTIIDNVHRTNQAGFSHERHRSIARLTSTQRLDKDRDLLVATRGSQSDSTFYYYGARMRFVPGNRDTQRAGIVIHNDGGTGSESGYYIEVQATGKVDRAQREEVVVISRPGNTIIGGKGGAALITPGAWFDLDLSFSNLSGTHWLSVAINGRVVLQFAVPSDQKVNSNGKFGMFLRGDTDVEYEYLYAVAQPPGERIDGPRFWDKVAYAFVGGEWDAEWVYQWRRANRRQRKKSGKEFRRWNKRFMDEFGPWVHEIRELDVKFEPAPVLYSKLYQSSPLIAPLEYYGGSWGAKIVLANMARRNVEFHGGDNGDVCIVFGRAIKVKDSESVTAKNDTQINIRGKIETEISSPWIQSAGDAQALADWIVAHWSKGADELDVTIFGNTLIELGDVVSVDYDELHMTAGTHKYFVTGTSSNFEAGIETTLHLRRVT